MNNKEEMIFFLLFALASSIYVGEEFKIGNRTSTLPESYTVYFVQYDTTNAIGDQQVLCTVPDEQLASRKRSSATGCEFSCMCKADKIIGKDGYMMDCEASNWWTSCKGGSQINAPTTQCLEQIKDSLAAQAETEISMTVSMMKDYSDQKLDATEIELEQALGGVNKMLVDAINGLGDSSISLVQSTCSDISSQANQALNGVVSSFNTNFNIYTSSAENQLVNLNRNNNLLSSSISNYSYTLAAMSQKIRDAINAVMQNNLLAYNYNLNGIKALKNQVSAFNKKNLASLDSIVDALQNIMMVNSENYDIYHRGPNLLPILTSMTKLNTSHLFMDNPKHNYSYASIGKKGYYLGTIHPINYTVEENYTYYTMVNTSYQSYELVPYNVTTCNTVTTQAPTGYLYICYAGLYTPLQPWLPDVKMDFYLDTVKCPVASLSSYSRKFGKDASGYYIYSDEEYPTGTNKTYVITKFSAMSSSIYSVGRGGSPIKMYPKYASVYPPYLNGITSSSGTKVGIYTDSSSIQHPYISGPSVGFFLSVADQIYYSVNGVTTNGSISYTYPTSCVLSKTGSVYDISNSASTCTTCYSSSLSLQTAYPCGNKITSGYYSISGCDPYIGAVYTVAKAVAGTQTSKYLTSTRGPVMFYFYSSNALSATKGYKYVASPVDTGVYSTSGGYTYSIEPSISEYYYGVYGSTSFSKDCVLLGNAMNYSYVSNTSYAAVYWTNSGGTIYTGYDKTKLIVNEVTPATFTYPHSVTTCTTITNQRYQYVTRYKMVNTLIHAVHNVTHTLNVTFNTKDVWCCNVSHYPFISPSNGDCTSLGLITCPCINNTCVGPSIYYCSKGNKYTSPRGLQLEDCKTNMITGIGAGVKIRSYVKSPDDYYPATCLYANYLSGPKVPIGIFTANLRDSVVPIALNEMMGKSHILHIDDNYVYESYPVSSIGNSGPGCMRDSMDKTLHDPSNCLPYEVPAINRNTYFNGGYRGLGLSKYFAYFDIEYLGKNDTSGNVVYAFNFTLKKGIDYQAVYLKSLNICPTIYMRYQDDACYVDVSPPVVSDGTYVYRDNHISITFKSGFSTGYPLRDNQTTYIYLMDSKNVVIPCQNITCLLKEGTYIGTMVNDPNYTIIQSASKGKEIVDVPAEALTVNVNSTTVMPIDAIVSVLCNWTYSNVTIEFIPLNITSSVSTFNKSINNLVDKVTDIIQTAIKNISTNYLDAKALASAVLDSLEFDVDFNITYSNLTRIGTENKGEKSNSIEFLVFFPIFSLMSLFYFVYVRWIKMKAPSSTNIELNNISTATVVSEKPEDDELGPPPSEPIKD